MIADAWLRKIQEEAAKGRPMTNQEAAKAIRDNWPDERYTTLREALTLALRALEPARVICPAVKGQDCEGCPHGIEHDHGDCEALDGCPGCVEVKP